MLNVTEIFASIQGEGPLMGRPATFLRLSGCVAPYCTWCDTPEALKPGTPVTPDQVEKQVLSHNQKLVVITGGEPFKQWDNGLDTLAGKLVKAGCILQYETSGKLKIPQNPGGMVVCSPKPADEPKLDSDQVERVDAFKFVIADNIEPVLVFCRQHEIAPDKTWLMPLGKSRQTQLERMPAVWKLCVEHGFRFSPRLQILAFDQKKGI